jgi:hypothetical protein
MRKPNETSTRTPPLRGLFAEPVSSVTVR